MMLSWMHMGYRTDLLWIIECIPINEHAIHHLHVFNAMHPLPVEIRHVLTPFFILVFTNLSGHCQQHIKRSVLLLFVRAILMSSRRYSLLQFGITHEHFASDDSP